MNEGPLVAAWWRIFKNQRLTVRSVVMTAIEGGEETSALRDALNIIAPPTYPGSPCSPHRLGKWLSRSSGKRFIVDGRIFVFTDLGNENGRIWQLRPVEETKEYHEEDILPDGFLDAVA